MTTSAAQVCRFIKHGKEILFHLPDQQDHIQRIIRRSGDFYEPAMLEDMRQRVQLGDLALDVGANIGNHSVFLAAVCGVRVQAFEPYAYLHSLLLENVRINAIESLVQAHGVALGATPGLARLDVAPMEKLGMTKLDIAGDGPGPRVRIEALDRLDIAGRIALLKIDVEGMELNVLRGGEHRLRADRPIIYAEAHSDAQFQEIAAFLADFGYSPQGVFNATPTYLFLPVEVSS
ncbi:MAG: FkbM family methyltransferase [Desulfocurvibacter africanus]